MVEVAGFEPASKIRSLMKDVTWFSPFQEWCMNGTTTDKTNIHTLHLFLQVTVYNVLVLPFKSIESRMEKD